MCLVFYKNVICYKKYNGFSCIIVQALRWGNVWAHITCRQIASNSIHLVNENYASVETVSSDDFVSRYIQGMSRGTNFWTSLYACFYATMK